MAGLLDTTNALIWAEEFTRIFNAHLVIGEQYGADRGGVPEYHIDSGTMLTWFANAIETGRNAGRKELCPHTDTFDIDDDTKVCRACGTLNPLVGELDAESSQEIV